MSRDTIVYVGNLPGDVRSREVEDLFDRFGRVRSVDIKPGTRDGMPAYCFVEYDDPRDADDAVRKMDGASAYGKRLRVSAGEKGGAGVVASWQHSLGAAYTCTLKSSRDP
jgi:arginine/serine-rich splicing factor 1/9